ncbi:hypothetical protein [uncultured Tateyamaria sp.]|uniref:hypothetical protein n=1 Tax=uncultured Tateyamaria sp. TaxID=455651 RepID=UPI00260486BE|nr:hypothetical protein [uncultured Tateyamaria sp.]
MLFLFGLLAGTVLSIFFGMIVFHVYGKPTHGAETNSIKKVVLSVPFLSLLVFALVCLAVAVTVDLLFLAGSSETIGSFLTSPKTWLAVTKELFFAAFIALIIIVVVEVASNDEQVELMAEFKESVEKLTQDSIDKAQESVFEGVYKNAVDPAVFEEVVDSIFTADFIREEHHRSIVLEPVADRDDIVLMKVKQTYTVKNVTKNIKSSNQRFYLPNTRNADGDLNQFTQLAITSEKGEKNEIPDTYPYVRQAEPEEDNSPETAPACDPAVPSVEPSSSGAETIYTFPTVKVQGGGVVRVELELQLVKDMSDNEILTFLSPTLKGSFSVHSYVSDLDIKAISLHRGALTETPDGGEDFKRWTFNRPMLPYQGYVVMWSKVT